MSGRVLYNSGMSTLADHVKGNFSGMLVFGDVHAEYDFLLRAYHYARSHNYFFMSLGDLVDRGDKPFETVKLMADAMHESHAGFTMGNHDDKFMRYSHGAKVSFSIDGHRTWTDVGKERRDEFMHMYAYMMGTPMYSSIYHKFRDIVTVHGASHPSIWDSTVRAGSEARSRFLYGEVNGEKYPDGLPVRLYNWIDEIPMGKTVIVGHDRSPIHNVHIMEPLVVKGSNGGTAVFMDTGAGKGGFLSGAVVKFDKNSFNIEKFVDFK